MASGSIVVPPRCNSAPTALDAVLKGLALAHHNLLAKQGALMLRLPKWDEYAGLVLVRPSVITLHLLTMHVCPQPVGRRRRSAARTAAACPVAA